MDKVSSYYLTSKQRNRQNCNNRGFFLARRERNLKKKKQECDCPCLVELSCDCPDNYRQTAFHGLSESHNKEDSGTYDDINNSHSFGNTDEQKYTENMVPNYYRNLQINLPNFQFPGGTYKTGSDNKHYKQEEDMVQNDAQDNGNPKAKKNKRNKNKNKKNQKNRKCKGAIYVPEYDPKSIFHPKNTCQKLSGPHPEQQSTVDRCAGSDGTCPGTGPNLGLASYLPYEAMHGGCLN